MSQRERRRPGRGQLDAGTQSLTYWLAAARLGTLGSDHRGKSFCIFSGKEVWAL